MFLWPIHHRLSFLTELARVYRTGTLSQYSRHTASLLMAHAWSCRFSLGYACEYTSHVGKSKNARPSFPGLKQSAAAAWLQKYVPGL